MKPILISLILLFFQSEQESKYFIFRVDESIPLENISFDKKEIDRWNRVIKVKSNSEIKFQVDVENRKYNFILDKYSIFRLNTISIENLSGETNQTLEIQCGDVFSIHTNSKNEKTNFKIKILSTGLVFYKDSLATKSKKLNNDFHQNPDFFLSNGT